MTEKKTTKVDFEGKTPKYTVEDLLRRARGLEGQGDSLEEEPSGARAPAAKRP